MATTDNPKITRALIEEEFDPSNRAHPRPEFIDALRYEITKSLVMGQSSGGSAFRAVSNYIFKAPSRLEITRRERWKPAKLVSLLPDLIDRITASGGQTVLHAAVTEDWMFELPSELVTESRLRVRDFSGWNPVHTAIHFGNYYGPDFPNLSLKYPAIMADRNNKNETPVHLAYRAGTLGVIPKSFHFLVGL